MAPVDACVQKAAKAVIHIVLILEAYIAVLLQTVFVTHKDVLLVQAVEQYVT
jgi:hypothetical protein